MRRLWIIFLFIAIPAMMFADVVTEQDALLKAKQFMPGKSFEQPQKPNRAPARDGKIDNPAYYVFNATGNEGFVIVSADDRTEAILGYADNGYFDQDNLPSNVKAWFEYYEQSIRSLGNAPAQDPQQRTPHAAIEPLIKTKWNQDTPYNLQCPMDGEERSITGCVATAIAQIMNYHQWPASTTQEIPAYTTKTKAINVEALPTTTFKWDLMKYEYQNDAVGDTASAVAELMRYCGQALLMDYTSDESGANINAANLINYFNYSKNTRETSREYYSNNQWEDLVYNEISNNRPVAYSGLATDTKSAHEFICDGYDGNGLFHINWGWGGYCDGFFSLSILNPSGRGLGGGSSSQGYSDLQWILIGFSPASNQEEPVPQMISWDVSVSESNYERVSTATDFESISLSGYIHTIYSVLPQKELEVETGWALYSDDTLKQCLGYKANTVSNTLEDDLNNNMSVSFGSDVKDGQYRICQVYRLAGETGWSLSQDAIRECLVVNITGNNMTIQKINYSTMITVNSLTSVGTAIKNEKSYVKANITNNGKNYKQTIIIKYHKNGLMGNASSSTITYLNPGETSDVILSFTPSSSGIYVVTVGDVTIEIPVIESILTISDFSTSIQPMLNVPFNLSFNVTYWGNDSVSTNIIKYWTKQEGEESWTEGDYFFIENITGVPVEKVLSFTPTALGTFQIRITNYDGTAECATFSTTVKKGEFETIDGITYACDPETHNATIVSADKNVIPSELVIPSSITHNSIEYHVKAIADYAFYFNESTGNYIGFLYTGIEKLKISEGIETIGRGAFRECLYIRRLDLPSTIKRIGKNAFFGQGKDIIIIRAQNPIDIDESVFGDNIFEDYTFGVKLCVPVGTKNNYLNCTGWNLFKNVYEGNTMATIDRIQYVGNSPSMEATMINYSQYYVSNELVIPATITIDNEEYTVTGIDADGLKVEYFPVRSLIIPEGVKYLGNTSFANQAELTTVDLPSTLTYIGDSAFYKCDNLKNVITRVKTPFAISNNTFSYGNTLLSVPSETEGLYKNTTGWNLFNYITEGLILEGEIREKSINGITYEYGTESRYAFIKKAASETPLASAVQSSITINGIEYSVTAIEDGAYSGAIQSESTGGGWSGKPKTYHGTLVIPEGIKKIGAYAFGSNYFVALELPSTLMAIDEYAFTFNEQLKKVTVKSGKTPFAYGDIFSFTDYAWIDTLFVPGGAVADYKADSVWNKTNIITDSTTIIAKSYSIKYGQELPTYAFTYKGAPVSGNPSITCSATSSSPAGTYPIKIGRGTVINGIRDTINGALTINKVPLLITANSYTIKQGDPIPELQVTYQGFVNNEDSTALSKLPTLSTSATSSSDPGVYVITVSGAESPNYTISYVKGTITIEGSSDISYTQEKNESVSIYSLNGTLLYPDVDLQIVFDQLPSGIYIIRQKNQRTRKLVK